MKLSTSILSILSVAYASIPVVDITSSNTGKYFTLSFQSINSALSQELSTSNGTPLGTAYNDYRTDNVYQFVSLDDGVQIRHMNDNKCLYIEATTNIVKSWECNADPNMVFNIFQEQGSVDVNGVYTHRDGVFLTHKVTGLDIEKVVTGFIGGSDRLLLDLNEVQPYLPVSFEHIRVSFLPTVERLAKNGNSISNVSFGDTYLYLKEISFKLEDSGNNTFRMKSVENGKCMYVEENTNLVKFYDCWNDDNMRFYKYKTNEPYHGLVHVNSGLCIQRDSIYAQPCDIRATSNNGRIGIDEQIVYTNGNNYYTEQGSCNVQLNGLCLDKYGVLSTCNSGIDQEIVFDDNGNGGVKIRSIVGQECLTVSQSTISYGDCLTGTDLDFEIIYMFSDPEGDNKIRHIETGKCLAYNNGLVLKDCDDLGTILTITQVSTNNIYTDVTASFVGVIPPRKFKLTANNMCVQAGSGVSYTSRFNYCVADSEVDPILVDRRNKQRYEIVSNGDGTVNLRRGDGQNVCVLPTVDDCLDVHDCYATESYFISDMKFVILDRYNGSSNPNYRIKHVESGMCLTFVGTGFNPDLQECDMIADNSIVFTEY